MMAKEIKIANAINCLKEAIKTISSDGYSYRKLALTMGDDSHWNENSIKQFAHREGSSRFNQNVRILSKHVVAYISGNPIYNDNTKIKENVLEIRRYVLGEFNSTINDHVQMLFLEATKTAFLLKFPKKFAFLRYSTDNKRIIIMAIEIHRGEDDYIYSMKITGGNNQKRIVLGDISHTIMNTYFTGLAFSVSRFVNDRELIELDIKNDAERGKYLAENPLGLEQITISNHQLVNTEFPVSFGGLDGKGEPIFGVGVMINSKIIDEFDIAAGILSSVSCNDNESKISLLLKKLNCKTEKLSS